MGILVGAAMAAIIAVSSFTGVEEVPVETSPIETQVVEFSEEIQEQMQTLSSEVYIPEQYFYHSDYQYKFKYNGVPYTIPMKVSNFDMSGMTVLSGSVNDSIDPGSTGSMTLMFSSGTMVISGINKTDNSLALGNCSLTSIQVAPWGSADFEGPDGTKIGDLYTDFDGSNLPGSVEDAVTDGNGYIRVYDYTPDGLSIGCIIYDYRNGAVNQIMVQYLGE